MRTWGHLLKNLSIIGLLASGAGPAPAQGTGLDWSTFLGGNGYDRAAPWHCVRVAANGDILVWGHTTSTDFPIKGAFQTSNAGGANYGDGFLARFTADGSSLVWSTYLGGRDDENILDLHDLGGGVITVCGWTLSPDFPTTAGAYQAVHAGGHDAFLARFAWNGQSLVMLCSTLLGSGGDDLGYRIALLPSGEVVVGGRTGSPGFPMRGTPFQPVIGGGTWDCFLAILSANCQNLLASTFFGGNGDDYFSDLLRDSSGGLVFVGGTGSKNIPITPNAYQPTHAAGTTDGFVAIVDANLGLVRYCSFLGGRDEDLFTSVKAGAGGQLAVGGSTLSVDFPVTQQAFQPNLRGGRDAVAVILDPRLQGAGQLVWSTYLGGTADDHVNGLDIDRSGLVTVAGYSASADFPVTIGAFMTRFQGGGTFPCDAIVSRLDPRAAGPAQLPYSTFLGGSAAWDYAYSVAMDDRGNAIVGGFTGSADFPTTPQAHDPTFNGSADLFLCRMSLLPRGAERFGASSPGCAWPIWQGVNSQARRGNASFLAHVVGAPPSSPGLLLFGPRCAIAWPCLNIGVHLQPLLAVSGPVQTCPAGSASLGLPIPAGVALGSRVALQWVFLTSGACPGTGPLAASEGLELFIY